MRSVAREFRTNPRMVQRWVARAGAKRLDRVDWSDRRSGAPQPVNRVSIDTESIVLQLRRELATCSDLGEFGAQAVHTTMLERELTPVPSIRTIGRILRRNGVLDGKQRIRRPAPRPGWYLPELSAGRAELDSFDTVVGLRLRGGLDVDVLNGISIHGGLISSWPRTSITATIAVQLLTSRWRELGLPTYAQFDNDNVFQGPHQYPDVVGQVIRLCLLLGVTPVFAPPREHGFQNAVESLNGRWQAKVWHRLHHESLLDVQQQTDRWVAAVRRRAAPRIEQAPTRFPFPIGASLDLRVHPTGTIIFIRRTDEGGAASVLGHRFQVASHWLHRLVRCEVDLTHECIRFFALRRHEPAAQPLLNEAVYRFPRRPFHLPS